MVAFWAQRLTGLALQQGFRGIDTANQRLVELRATLQSTLIEIAQKVSPEGRKHMRVPGGL